MQPPKKHVADPLAECEIENLAPSKSCFSVFNAERYLFMCLIVVFVKKKTADVPSREDEFEINLKKITGA